MRRLVVAMVAFTLILVVPGTAAGKPSSPITVDKTAVGHVTRTFSWEITKSATPDVLDIPFGGSATSTFEVSVTRPGHVDVSSVAGNVCVSNESSTPTDIVGVTDEVESRPGKGKWLPLASMEVDLDGVKVIGPGETHCYPYDVEFTPVDDADYRNVATVSSVPAKGKKLGRVTAKVGFTLPEAPDVYVNETITVDDTNGMSWMFSDTGAVTYDEAYGAAGTFTNTATITETGRSASATVTVNVGEPCSTTLDAVAYWCFDDQANPTVDGADGHDADVVGAQFETFDVPAVEGNVAALRLDGIDDYTTTPDPDGENNLDGFSGITLAAWINPDGPQSSNGCCGAILSKYARSDTGVSWGLDLAGSNLRFVYPGGEWTTPAATVTAGEWTHVAGTWDGDAIYLYVNGVLVGTGPNPYLVMGDTTTPVSVGSYTAFAGVGRAGFFDGLIDEAYIFSRALDSSEIASLPGGSVPELPSCATDLDAVAYWCFDDRMNPTSDGADGHDAQIVGATFDTADIPPIPGNVAALDLDGVDDYAWAPDPGGDGNLDGFNGLTLAGWINPDSLTSPWGSRIIVSKYNSSSPHNTISYWLLQRGDEVEVFVSRERVVDEDRLMSSGVDLVPGAWVHVVGTWDGSNLRLFVNGTQVAAKATTVQEMDDSNIQVDIGAAESFADGQRSALFDGSLDEVYIFDRALTPAEIVQLADT